ncbi:MAG: hypothetical protein LF888_01640 [Candidatus Megaira endosymbiont of Mesostigma viride]|nr:MAG: hypothetical protein LF888_01640 [Candidatus Megaira endosymbiont of Mesostigma viride]HJK88593.1 hypothetical protein [Candidatus Megaira endosymbiont of Mesostigma viride]
MKYNVVQGKFNFSLLPLDLQEKLKVLESEAQEQISQFTTSLIGVLQHETRILEEGLSQSDLTLEEQEQAKTLFKQTILKPLEEIESNLRPQLSETEESKPFSIILLETLVKVLTSIQNFKTKLDEILPIKCDEIISFAVPALLLVVTAYSPALGFVLNSTGLLETVASFFKDENLQKTIDNLIDTKEKLNKDSSLEVIGKISELAIETGLSATALGKFGFNSNILSSVLEGVTTTAGIKSFMQEVSGYADKVFPQNEKEIDTTLEFIKNSAVSALQKTGIPEALTSKIKVQIEQQAAVAKDVLKQNLDPSISIFDKIKIQQNGANLMLECLNQVTKTVKAHISDPKDIEVITAVVADVLKKGIKDRIQGNIEKIATQVQDPQVKNFAKKALGAGHANLLDIAKGVMKSLSPDTSRAM